MEERQQIRDDSDDLLSALNDLKQMEGRKRTEDISSPPFHDLAEAVEDQARHVYRLAAEERIDGDQTSSADVSTNEVSPSNQR